MPWQKEDWVDPYAKYLEILDAAQEARDLTIITIDRFFEIIKEEKRPHDWAKEGF